MLESTESLLPNAPSDGSKLKVLCVGETTDDLDELGRLLDTLDVNPKVKIPVQIRRISPATYIGSGKIEELKALMESQACEALVVDFELTPNQLRNFEEVLGKPVIDRPGVIIEIFSRHARTKESKTQVEIAKLQYLLPRLAHFWDHFERQRGGGVGNKGMGETQIEVDRRLVKRRIQILVERLGAIEKERVVQRSSRQDVLKVALVGYTNAGKSTLLNALTHSRVLVEDKLFATLDSSVRTLNPHSHPPIVAIDTVGFISRLPHSLVASFRSTLEELHQADLLIHVVDGSSNQAREQFETTEKVLEELEVSDKPRITVLNKADECKTPMQKNRAKLACPGALAISAFNPDDVIRLRDLILNHFTKNMNSIEVVVPYSESKLDALVHAHGTVETTRHLEKGTFYRLKMAETWVTKLGLHKYLLGNKKNKGADRQGQAQVREQEQAKAPELPDSGSLMKVVKTVKTIKKGKKPSKV